MKNVTIACLVFSAALLSAGCGKTLDPLSSGSTDGQYALGTKALVPFALGNTWTYAVVLYDSVSGSERMRYTYTLTVVDTVTADTGRIPLSGPAKRGLTRESLRWYLLEGELGARTCWQVDSVENLCIRRDDDSRFFEQRVFNFRAALGDSTPARYIGPDTSMWASGENVVTRADSSRTTLVAKTDTLRTTLGSAPYFKYRQSFLARTEFTTYYFKPGFGLVLTETYRLRQNGTTVRIRRDELVSYYFK